MTNYKKILSLLALLLTAATGAWAQNAPATFPFPITWDATNKSTSFNLPAGNVFMNVEYYPVAELTTAPAAKSNIQATTDDAIIEAGTMAKIGETENAQGILMYYAVQSETAPVAPDYDNQGWSDQVPTAAAFKQGNVYVWYYVKGADGDAESTFNDGAITKLGETGYVTLAAPPTYAITLKEDTEEFDKWTISQAEATKGTTITATYKGDRKVKSVKAVKKAKGKTVDLSTYSGDSYEVTEDVTFTGTTNNKIGILYKGEGYEVTLDNVNAPKCFIAAQDDNYNINVKLKGTSRLMGIYTQNAYIIIGEAAAGGTVILVDEETPLGSPGTTITINGGTVKAKTSSYSALDSSLEVNGGAVYLEAGEGNAAAGYTDGSVTLYGWNGSAWGTYTNQRYLSTDNSKAPSEWTW